MKPVVKIMIPIVIALAAFVVLDNPVEARDPLLDEVKPMHKMDFGISLGFFNDVPIETPAFDQLKRDDIHNIIFYEPWAGNKTNEDIADYLAKLVKKGFHVEVSLSNFPKEEGVTFKDYYDMHKGKTDPMPKEKIKRSFKFSNRFPPMNYENYTDTLKQLLGLIKNKGIAKKVSFEIGSEPNANLYFWGDENDFRKYYNTIRPILKAEGYQMTCCGYSTGYFNHPRDRAAAMRKDFDKFIKRDGITQSFSMYLTTWGTQKTDLATFPANYAKGGQISAYGTYAKLNSDLTERNKELDEGTFMVGVLEMIRFSYKYKIVRSYLWKLIDVEKKKGTAGYFTVDGKPKPRYKHWMTLYNVIKDGFYVVENDRKMHIVGKSQTLIFAKQDTAANFEADAKTLKSYRYNASKRQLEKHGWVVVTNK